tara:strand:+ start:161 stop:556 length:396 start_codon:yes stop_codon:yes gene_type:complete
MKIFEYDSTYHDIYKKVHEEFFNCSRTWRIISKRSKDEESRGWYYRQHTPYNMTYSAAKKLAEYWNYKYRYDENLGEMYLKWVRENVREDNDDFKYTETWFDIEQKKSINKVFRIIKDYKYLSKKGIKSPS